MDWAAPVRSHPSLLHHGLVPMGPGADPHGFPAAAPYPAAAAAHCQPRSHPTGMLGGCTGVQTFPKAATWSIPVPRHFSPPMVPVPGDTRDGGTQHGPRGPGCSRHCCKTTGRRTGTQIPSKSKSPGVPPPPSTSMPRAGQQWPQWSRGSGNSPSTSEQPPTTVGKVWGGGRGGNCHEK